MTTETPPSILQRVLKVAAPIAVFFIGVVLTALLVITKPKESRSEVATPPTSVSVLTVQVAEHTALVPSTGLVEPSQQITVVPQVTGKVVHVPADLAPGKLLERGQLLASIERRDYAAAVEEARSNVTAASLELQIEERRGRAVEREFALLGQEPTDGVSLREPHLANAQQRLRAAEAGLERAELNLARTSLSAPFNAVVLTESVDLGQVVGGAPVATLAGTDTFLVRASVPVDRLALLGLPARATVRHDGQERAATVVWSESQLDPMARTAKLIVEVDRPLDGEVPLLLGSFVELDIHGVTTTAVAVPREALDGTTVWLADSEDRLTSRAVQVGWTDAKNAYVVSGLESGERIVVSRLSYPVEGMALAVSRDEVAK